MTGRVRTSVRTGGRVQRVPYDQAERLIGTKALTHGKKERLLIDWRSRGVPPEWLCWRLIEAVESGRLDAQEHAPEPAVVQRVRAIAERTAGRGYEWEHLEQLVDMVYRNIRRAPSR